MRPHRPDRCRAEAWLIGSIGSRCTLVRWLYREMRAVPGSTTYRMPGTVSDVSATLVASTIRRPVCGGEDLVLLGGRQPRVERHDLGARQAALAQRVGGVADLPLAGQEHQDVARPLGDQLGDRRRRSR